MALARRGDLAATIPVFRSAPLHPMPDSAASPPLIELDRARVLREGSVVLDEVSLRIAPAASPRFPAARRVAS